MNLLPRRHFVRTLGRLAGVSALATLRPRLQAAFDDPPPAAIGPGDAFVPLFNGHSLRGWTNVNCAPNTFTVRNGLIVSTGVPTGVMRTTRHYENFILELEWKHLRPGGNAGLFVYAEPITAPGVPFAKAIEVQILDGDSPDGIWTGHGDLFSIHGARMVPDRPHPRGWERCLPNERRAHPAGDWNRYRVESRSGRLTLAVNGKVVSGASQCRPRRGYICLESEGSECHFRNLRICELPSSDPPPGEIAGFDQRFRSLYTGIDLAGWRVNAAHGGHWTAKDWVLDCDGEGAGTLVTTRHWRDFSVICDWRMPTAGRTAGLLPRGDRSPEIALAAPDNAWHRTELTLRAGRLALRQDGTPLQPAVPPARGLAHGPIGLRHHGQPVQFANIYAKPLG
jgi:hypothetical protein